MSQSTQVERDILRSARFQHSSLTQSVKQDAIDRMVEQSLGLARAPLSIDDIVSSSSLELDGNIQVLRITEARAALERLRKRGRLRVSKTLTAEKYTLTRKAQNEFNSAKVESERRARRIASKLFKNLGPDPDSMVAPFFELLGKVFSQLSGTYIAILTGREKRSAFLSGKELATAIQEVIEKYHVAESKQFRRAITSFFEQRDPDFDAVKWNIAQNYYISLALGLDPSGALLSKELFDTSSMYLDTNLVIHGVEPSSSRHSSFRALVRVCERMGVTLCVWSDTLSELSRVVDHYTRIVPIAAPKIPETTKLRVRNIFYKLYEIAQNKDEDPDLRLLYRNFIDARRILEEDYGISIDADDWHDRMHSDKTIVKEKDRIRKFYQVERARPKGPLSALHDVLLLLKIQSRCNKNLKTMIVTLDHLLPSFRLVGQRDDCALSIGLDAFLQWISPFGIARKDQKDFEALFSEAISSHLLPQESFFEIGDFLVFAEIDWDTKELPAGDVEDCIRHLKRIGPSLDPTKPEDREKLQYEVTKFFTDPSRKHKAEVQRLEKEVVNLSTKESEQRRLSGSEIADRDQTILELKEEVDRLRLLRKQDKVRQSAVRRLFLVLLLFAIGLTAITLFAHFWGTGQNLFEKVKGAWPFYSANLLIAGGLFRIILGKDRIKSLGWAIRSIAGDDKE